MDAARELEALEFRYFSTSEEEREMDLAFRMYFDLRKLLKAL